MINFDNLHNMPRAGFEPARECSDDFKSSASTVPPPRLINLLAIIKKVVNNKIFWNNKGTFLKTSGSMGSPKIIFHTWFQHMRSAVSVIENTQLSNKSISLLSLPLNHISGLSILIRAYCSGGKWLLPPIGWSPRWAYNNNVTHLSLVSTQLFRFMKNKEDIVALRSMQAILLGGSSISCNLIKEAYFNKLPIIVTYGSTETASQVTATRPRDRLLHLYSSGRCLKNHKIEIRDKEIVIRSKTVGVNILKQNLSLNCRVLSHFATGDLGYLDSDGYLHVLGRKDNCFISGGENVYPEEIERILLKNSSVEDALVISVHNAEYGRVPVAFVKTNLDLSLIEDFLRKYLEGFKIPKKWHYWPNDLDDVQKPSRCFFSKLLSKYYDKNFENFE